jgi:hypothetical protein
MPPGAAVARLAEIVAGRSDFTEDDIYGAMAEAGFPRAVASRAYEFTMIAWGRQSLEGLGVRFSAEYFCFNAAGEVVESGLLAEQPHFVAATALAKQYSHFPGFLRLASMASDVTAINSALNSGSKPENLSTSPVAVFVEGATPVAIDKARQLLSPLVVAPANYTHPVYGWSVSYPDNWLIDSSNPSFVRIRSDDDAGLCGIHSFGSRWNTLDDLTDSVLAHNERFFQNEGLRFVVLARRRISLPNGITGNDVLTQILPHREKSRRIYVHEGGRAFVIDCETWPENWENLESVFDRIVNSFTLARGRPPKKWWEFWK